MVTSYSHTASVTDLNSGWSIADLTMAALLRSPRPGQVDRLVRGVAVDTRIDRVAC